MKSEIPAFVCSHVFAKTSLVKFVSRLDGDWQLLCGEGHDEDEIPRVIGLNHLLDDDPSLRAIQDLPADWEAERIDQGGPWQRRPAG